MSDDTTLRLVGYRTCSLCEAMCGLELNKRGDQWLVRGDRHDPFSKGFICPKGTTMGALHDDPDRLRSPLIRTGDDPATATWREVTWDEAFAEIDARLTAVIDRTGRDSLAIYAGNPNVHSHENSLFLPALIKAMGSRNVFSASTVDQMPKHVSSGLLFGDPGAIPVPDLDRTDFLLMLGANPYESNGSLCTAADFPGRLEALVARGGQLVVVDPRRTKTAERATQYLSIRPGTDAHLLLGIAHVLLREPIDLGSLGSLVDGVDRVTVALEDFTPEAVASVTGIEAATIVALAEDLAGAPTAAVYARIGSHTNRFGTLASWATDLLNVLTGNLDREGGALFALPAHGSRGTGKGRGFQLGRWASRVRGLAEARSELPVAALAEEILTPGEGQIRALFTVAGNPALSCPDSGQIDRALVDLDLLVCVDPWLNETTRHAHVILPPPGPLARSHYDLAFTSLAIRNVAKWTPALVPSDELAEWAILARLAALVAGFGPDGDPVDLAEAALRDRVDRSAAALGRDPDELRDQLQSPDRSPADQLVDLMVRTGPYGDRFGEEPDGLSLDVLAANPHGVDMGPLRPRLPDALKTVDGRIDLLGPPLSEDLERLRTDLHSPVTEGLVLVGRRHLRSNNSWMHNVRVLVKGRTRCTLQVHPDDAGRLSLQDGGRAVVRSRAGSLTARVELTDTIRPGVVSLPHGWGHDVDGVRLSVASATDGVNSNVLTDAGPIDPLSGNAQLNAIPVDVTPVLRDAGDQGMATRQAATSSASRSGSAP
ncbi:MAG: molybdopterin-dependent oxidoreductase [Acidimicrobiia bacterium]|nr:molybdopterin-dependent oxidoreductase [Acidimicrobiia bacterium]